MTRERRIGLMLLGAVGVIVLLVAAIVIARETRTLYYTMVFDDARGIREGDRVVLNGVDVGEVKWVRLYTQPNSVDVRLKVYPKFREEVKVGSTGIIRSVSFPNVSGQQVVEVINPESDTPQPPLPKDATVYGQDGKMELELWKLKHKLRGASDDISSLIGALADNVRELSKTVQQVATSPQVQAAVADLKAFMIKMQEQGRAAVGELQREWPAIRKELEPAMKELHDFGRDYLANQLRQMMGEIERTLREWQRLPAGAPPANQPPA